MKRWITALLALSLLMGALSGCAAGGEPKGEEETAEAPEAEAQEEEAPEETPEEEASEEEASEEAPEEVELVIFAAASMQETLEALSEDYREIAPHVTLVFNFDSSGTLKTQIEEGAVCDLFISAGQKQMDQLDIEADPSVNTDGLDFVLEESRIDLLENKVALCVAEGSDKGIASYADLAAALERGDVLLAMGNADVPVGQYTQKILAYYGLDEEELAAAGCLSYGSNVKEVTTQVAEAAVDCGIIYQTDAYSAGLSVTDTATEEMCGQVIYPAAVLKTSEHQAEAQAYLDFLTGQRASEVFEEVGFTPMAQ